MHIQWKPLYKGHLPIQDTTNYIVCRIPSELGTLLYTGQKSGLSGAHCREVVEAAKRDALLWGSYVR